MFAHLESLAPRQTDSLTLRLITGREAMKNGNVLVLYQEMDLTLMDQLENVNLKSIVTYQSGRKTDHARNKLCKICFKLHTLGINI